MEGIKARKGENCSKLRQAAVPHDPGVTIFSFFRNKRLSASGSRSAAVAESESRPYV